jgi:hypothetical protein
LGKLLVALDKKLARMYYDPCIPSGFSTLAKFQAAVREAKGKQPLPRVTQDWLHQQNTTHFTSLSERDFLAIHIR